MCQVEYRLTEKEKEDNYMGYKVATIEDGKIKSICTDIEYKKGRVYSANYVRSEFNFDETLLDNDYFLFSPLMNQYNLTACFTLLEDAVKFANMKRNHISVEYNLVIIAITFDTKGEIFIGVYNTYDGLKDVILGNKIKKIKVLESF